MSDYGVEIYAENKRRLFTSHQRILKLQGFRVIRGSGGQKIELKQYQRPFFYGVTNQYKHCGWANHRITV